MITMESVLEGYEEYFQDEERNRAMVEEYLRGVRKFMRYLAGDTELNKNRAGGYKQWLRERYTIASVNSMLAVVNNFLVPLGKEELQVKLCKVQQVPYSRPERGLTEPDYKRLVYVTRGKGDMRMSVLPQAIRSTGIRISELKYITVESLKTGRAEIYNKGESGPVLLPAELTRMLKRYCGKMNLHARSIFVTGTGRVLDRGNINKRIEQIGEAAGMGTAKVFPYNPRRLFVRTFYDMEEDMVRLMDLLGHSNINTTGIYTAATEELPRQQVARMHLVLG